MASLVGLLLILIFAGVGVFRGGSRMLLSLLVLFFSGLFASKLGPIGAAVDRLTGLVPLALLPIAGVITTGILLFIAMMIPVEITLRKREKQRAEAGLPARQPWEAPLGGVLGAVWGLVLLLVCMTGLSMISGVQKSMRYANAEIDYLSERRRKETLRVQQFARITHTTAPPIDEKSQLAPIDETKLKPEPPTPAEEIGDKIDHSIFAPMVKSVDPLDDSSEKSLRDLTVVVGDPVLYDRFCAEPQVAALVNEPKLVELSKDQEVAAAVRDRRYRDLLNNEKLAALLDDHELVGKLKALKIDKLLKEVRSPASIQMGVGHPAYNEGVP